MLWKHLNSRLIHALYSPFQVPLSIRKGIKFSFFKELNIQLTSLKSPIEVFVFLKKSFFEVQNCPNLQIGNRREAGSGRLGVKCRLDPIVEHIKVKCRKWWPTNIDQVFKVLYLSTSSFSWEPSSILSILLTKCIKISQPYEHGMNWEKTETIRKLSPYKR